MSEKRQQREKWIEVVEEYEGSGLTQAQFVVQRGVALSTLQSWLRRRKAQRTGGNSSPDPVVTREAGA